MRSSLLLILLLAGCSNGFQLPVNALTSAEENAIYQARQAEVEVIVKSNFDAVIRDIRAGGGPTLTSAFDAAGVPDQERATRAFQLNNDLGLYAGNPGALVTAIMVYGSS